MYNWLYTWFLVYQLIGMHVERCAYHTPHTIHHPHHPPHPTPTHPHLFCGHIRPSHIPLCSPPLQHQPRALQVHRPPKQTPKASSQEQQLPRSGGIEGGETHLKVHKAGGLPFTETTRHALCVSWYYYCCFSTSCCSWYVWST